MKKKYLTWANEGNTIYIILLTGGRTQKHWHGVAKDSWFSHLAVEVPGENGSNEWLEAVTDDMYSLLK